MPCHAYIGTLNFRKWKCYLTMLIGNVTWKCPLVWHFHAAVLSQKIEKIQELALRLSYNDSYCCYNSLLLKMERPTIDVSRLRILAIEVFKTLKHLHSDFMRTYFQKGSHSARRKNDLVVNSAKTTTFGEKSFRTVDQKFGILYLKTSKT